MPEFMNCMLRCYKLWQEGQLQLENLEKLWRYALKRRINMIKVTDNFSIPSFLVKYVEEIYENKDRE